MQLSQWTTKSTFVAGMLVLVLSQTTLLSNQAMAGMFGFMKRYDVQLSPEVSGRVTLEGKPIPGLKIMRELTYEKEYLDETTTDSDGRFHFSEKNIQSRIPGRAFDETRNRQVIAAYHNDKNYLLWHAVTSRVTEPPKTLVQKLANLNCDLTTPEKLQHFPIQENPTFTHNIHSICRWENDE